MVRRKSQPSIALFNDEMGCHSQIHSPSETEQSERRRSGRVRPRTVRYDDMHHGREDTMEQQPLSKRQRVESRVTTTEESVTTAAEVAEAKVVETTVTSKSSTRTTRSTRAKTKATKLKVEALKTKSKSSKSKVKALKTRVKGAKSKVKPIRKKATIVAKAQAPVTDHESKIEHEQEYVLVVATRSSERLMKKKLRQSIGNAIQTPSIPARNAKKLSFDDTPEQLGKFAGKSTRKTTGKSSKKANQENVPDSMLDPNDANTNPMFASLWLLAEASEHTEEDKAVVGAIRRSTRLMARRCQIVTAH